MNNPFEILEERLRNIESLLRGLQLRVTSNEDAPTTKQEQLMTVQEAARYLHLSVHSIYRMVQQEEIPHHKKSRRLYFFESELLEYVKSGHQQTLREIEAEDPVIPFKPRRR